MHKFNSNKKRGCTITLSLDELLNSSDDNLSHDETTSKILALLGSLLILQATFYSDMVNDNE